MDSLLTVQDVANLLGVKVSTVYKWRYQKKIPYHKVNGLLRFNRDDLLMFIESKKNTPD